MIDREDRAHQAMLAIIEHIDKYDYDDIREIARASWILIHTMDEMKDMTFQEVLDYVVPKAEPVVEVEPEPIIEVQPDPILDPPATLVDRVDLTYLGHFLLPKDDGTGVVGNKFENGAHAVGLARDGGSMFIAGHREYGKVAEILVEEPSVEEPKTAGFKQLFADPIGELRWSQNSDHKKWWRYGGFLESGGHVLFTLYMYYNVTGANYLSQGAFGVDMSDVSKVEGLWAPGPLGESSPMEPWHLNKHAGYMFGIPLHFADEYLDGRYIGFGQQGLSGQAMTSLGPSFYCMKPRDVMGNLPGPGEIDDASPLKYNPHSATREYDELDHKLADRWRGGSFIETSEGNQAFISIGRHGLGEEFYGIGSDYPGGNACVDWKGYHADPYQAEIRFYDPMDLVAVYQGVKDPWSVEPYHRFVIDEYLIGGCLKWVGGLMFDQATRRLYFIEEKAHQFSVYTKLPVVHCFQVA